MNKGWIKGVIFRGNTIFAPYEELINFTNVSQAFKDGFMEEWRKSYDLEAHVGGNSGINQLSVLEEMAIYLNKEEVIEATDSFDEAYSKVTKLMLAQ